MRRDPRDKDLQPVFPSTFPHAGLGNHADKLINLFEGLRAVDTTPTEDQRVEESHDAGR
jgi:hypothetical protein